MAKFNKTKKLMMDKKDLIREHEELVKDLKGSKKQYEDQKNELQELKRHYDDGGEVTPDSQDSPDSDDAKSQALQQLGSSPKLSQDDFTKPGEQIPRDAGFGDFVKYNVAHFNPADPDTAMSMATASGGITKLPFAPASIIGPHLPAAAKEFQQALANAIEQRPLIKQMVTQYSPEEYASMKTFLSPDKASGYAVKPNGELVSVFSAAKGRGDNIVPEAIKQGANRLDAFDKEGKLPDLYQKHGFEEYKREPNYEKGGPDVVYMAKPEVLEGLFKNRNDLKREAIQKALEKYNVSDAMDKTQPTIQLNPEEVQKLSELGNEQNAQLERTAGTIRDLGNTLPKPDYSQGVEKAMQNYYRKGPSMADGGEVSDDSVSDVIHPRFKGLNQLMKKYRK